MRGRSQHGVAIITALVVVAAATVAVSAMMWRESVAVRKAENQAALGQARWLARSAIEWARLVLLQDARTSSVDHLGEIWAIPLAETRVTDDLGAERSAAVPPGTSATPFADNDAAWISGRMHDAQAKLNLQGMARGDQLDDERYATLKRLVETLRLDPDVAKAIARRVAVLPWTSTFDDLARAMRAEGTIDAATVERLRPFVVILPAPTPVNLNTAPAEVLAAVFSNLPLDAARSLVRTRDQAWFKQVADVEARMPGAGGDATPTHVSITTSYFELEGRVQVGRAELAVAALIEREQNGTTRVRSLTQR